MKIGAAVVNNLALSKRCRERSGTDIAVVIAGICGDDFDTRSIDEEPVGLAPGSLVEKPHHLINRHPGEERMLADEVPVTHPWSAEVADISTEVESPRLSQLFGDAVRKSVGLRYRKQWRARFDSIDNAGLQVTKLGRCIDFTRLGDMAGFHWWRCGFEARGFTCGVVGGGVGG